MTAKITLQEREKQLQALLATAAGKEELQQLSSQYSEKTGRLRPAKASVITAILVFEREHGIIEG